MRILVFSWRGPGHPLAGGAEQVMHEHMKGWVDGGHKVTLFTSSFKGGRGHERIDGVDIVRRGKQLLGVHIAGFFWYLSHASEFDLIVDQFHGIPFFTPVYTRKPKIAVVQEVARKVWLENDLPFPLNFIIGWIGYIFEPVVFLLYRRSVFITGSASAKEDLQKVFIPEGNIRVINHGVIIKKPKKMPAKEKIKTVIFLGALAKDKGVEDAIEAFCMLKTMGEYRYWVVGRGGDKYVNLLKGSAEKCGIGQNIKFWGYVDLEKKFELLARAHVLVNPSMLEGWGLVNIEANAVGTPVVAYRSRGLVDSVKDGKSGTLVDENTPAKLAGVIDGLLGDSGRYDELRRGALSWSNNFDWRKSRRMSLKLIDKNIIVS